MIMLGYSCPIRRKLWLYQNVVTLTHVRISAVPMMLCGRQVFLSAPIVENQKSPIVFVLAVANTKGGLFSHLMLN